MDEFFNQQMVKLPIKDDGVVDAALAEAVESGLVLDVLHFHTTDQGTADAHSLAELHQIYHQRAEIIDQLITRCKELYLFILTQIQQHNTILPATRLAHDALATVVIKAYRNSDKRGQRAARILSSKLANFKIDKEGALLNEADLAVVEKGQNGMRQLSVDEQSLVTRSQEIQACLQEKVKYLDVNVKARLQKLGYYDKLRNPEGKGVQHQFELVKRHGQMLVVDHATGPTWQQSGSKNYMNYAHAEKYIFDLNTKHFAGHDDWRLPTLEEAMALMEAEQKKDGLYIDLIFHRLQRWIWTSSKHGADMVWLVGFSDGYCNAYTVDDDTNVRAVR